MGAPPQPLTRPTYALVTAASVCFSLLWALTCLLVVEFLQVGGNIDQILTQTLGQGIALYLLGGVLVWFLLILIWAIAGRLRFACGLLIALSIILGYANYKKIELRLEPLYPSDFAFAGNTTFLSQMLGLGTVLGVLGFVALVTVTVWWLGTLIGRNWPRVSRRTVPRRWAATVVVRVLVIAISFGVLGYATQFNQSGNQVRAAYERAGAHWAFWFQRLNYARNGFVGGLLYNMQAPSMDKPRGYSEDTMASIGRRYSAVAQRWNASTDGHRLADVNIVLVLSEAFSDPENLEGVEYARDPIPFTRQVMRSTTSGTMLAQLFGGGTANMEFEALTGMSLSQFKPQMQTPYQMMIPNFHEFPSAVAFAKHHGLTPIAIHPYMTSMYKRETVYPILGFEDFLGEGDIHSPRRLGKSEFISDESAFSEVTRQIRDRDEPLLVNLVTMQNHYPNKELYADPLEVSGVSGEAKAQAEGYGRGLRYTDSALRDFLGTLAESEERTAVVFYGDHLPAIWPERIQERNGKIGMRSTPFFIWANFPLDLRYDLPLTSPIYFLPLLFDAVDAAIPPYYALLLEMYAEIPAMEQGVYVDAEGHQVAKSGLSERARALLRDYRLVQYDLSIGERYSLDKMFYSDTALASAPIE